MIAAFFMLSSLLALLPALIMMNETLASGLVSAIVAIATVSVAFTLHTIDLNRFSRLLGPTAFIVLFIPCLWMLLQVLPIPIRSLANPIWISASTALDKPFVGAISLDIGAALLSLAHYCAALAAAFIAAAVTLNRQRAESVLSLLTAIAALISAQLIGFDLGYLHLPEFDHANSVNIAVLGFILSCATAIQTYEHLYGLSARRRDSSIIAKASIFAPVAALVACLSAILISTDTISLLAALFGTGVLISIWAIRRWRLSLWGRAGIAAFATVAIVGFFAIAPAPKDTDPALALSARGQTTAIERMSSDTKWRGAGAGSFEALSPIYRDTDQFNSSPTTAAIIAIEMGQPFLWACIIVFLIGASTLFMRALNRGRDYVYSSAGAGCIIALLISLFANDGILGLTTSVMISVLCGLAFAQSKSSSNKDLELSGGAVRYPEQTTRTNNRAVMEVSR